MTAQKGKDLLLKVDTNGAGSFVTVAGFGAWTLAFNAATVDVTDTESVGRYKGRFELEPSPQGGLRARLQLPAA